MRWWILAAVGVFLAWGAGFWFLSWRAGTHRLRYSDGCAKPIVDSALRADGSRKNIIPRPGDGEIDDLEHLLEHKIRASA